MKRITAFLLMALVAGVWASGPALAAARTGADTAPGGSVVAPGTTPSETPSKTPGKTGAKTGAEKTPPAPPPATPPAPPPATPSAEQQRVAEIEAELKAGNFDKALDLAKVFLLSTHDERAKTDALRIVAEAYRKKGDWRQAPNAYPKVRDRFEKNSDDYVKWDAVAEVLRGAPTGVYQPGGVGPAKAPDGKTLADDAVLAEALTRLAGVRMAKVKAHAAPIRRGRTPQEVVAAFVPVAEEARQVFLLSAEVSPDVAREAGAMAGTRLKELGIQIIPNLDAKITKYQPKYASVWSSFTNVEKRDIQQSLASCKEMVQAEKTFQENLFFVSGQGEWPDAQRLRQESSERQAEYTRLMEIFSRPYWYY